MARGTYELGWRESIVSGHQRIVFAVTRVVLVPPRWRVVAVVTNKTEAPLLIDRPHRPGQTLFGLLNFRSGSQLELAQAIKSRRYRAPAAASTFRPLLPAEIRPGATWRGVFSGPGAFSRGSYLRVEFGRFVPYGPIPPGLSHGTIELTDHALELRH
jgi:hypothetical protein